MRVIWSPSAQADRHRIWMFTAEHSVDRADRIDARLLSRAKSLGDLPSQGRPLEDRSRRLSITDVQLVLTYRIAEDENTVRILQVRHTRQNRDEP